MLLKIKTTRSTLFHATNWTRACLCLIWGFPHGIWLRELVPKFHSLPFPWEAQNGEYHLCSSATHSQHIWLQNPLVLEAEQGRWLKPSKVSPTCCLLQPQDVLNPRRVNKNARIDWNQGTDCFLSCLAPFWTRDQEFQSQMIHQTPTPGILLASTQNLIMYSGQELCETPPGLSSRGKCAQ